MIIDLTHRCLLKQTALTTKWHFSVSSQSCSSKTATATGAQYRSMTNVFSLTPFTTSVLSKCLSVWQKRPARSSSLLSRKPKEECGFTVQEQGSGGRLCLSTVILEFGPCDVFCNLQMIESFNFLHTSSNTCFFYGILLKWLH